MTAQGAVKDRSRHLPGCVHGDVRWLSEGRVDVVCLGGAAE